MLSDEEKKAIEGLFHLAHINTYLDLEKEDEAKISRTLIDQWRDETEILLNLIEKQSKEIEELKLKIGDEKTFIQLGECIGEKKVNDKIKAKIEELKERPNKMVIDKEIPEEYKNIFLDENAILVLQSLLEKE